MTRLEARALVHVYPGGVRALERVDLDLSEGDLLAVIGPNGSGKSTLLRCLAGLLRPTGGEARLDGRPVGGFAPRERARRVAVVPQYLPALPDLRVKDFVFGARYAHLPRLPRRDPRHMEVVRAALERADAADLAERLMSELSGGQRQRVLLARALAQEADLVLFDEPTSSLDPEHQLAAFERIGELARDRRAALVVTHDLNLASQFARRVLVLHEGRAAALGSPREVLRREVLEPVYGASLHYGSLRGRDGVERPFVVPWR